MLVVNEPELTKAIGRLRGEWAELSGGQLEALDAAWPDLAKADAIDADLVVFPSRYLGEMSMRGWLRPVRQSVLESDTVDAADFFPVVQRRLIRWGGQTMALPLGVTLPKEPEKAEHPGIVLLDVAAPTAVSDDRMGVLFDPETMQPRITEPAFVEALAKLSQQEGDDETAIDLESQPRIPVLGFADRLVGVSASSRNAASAFKLLAWLASPEISAQLRASNKSLMPVRRSLASSAEWYGPDVTAGERQALAAAVDDILSKQRELIIPRIPGVDDYIAALDDAVKSVVAKNASPEEALTNAAARWEEITESRGRDAQRQAYLKHLGIEE